MANPSTKTHPEQTTPNTFGEPAAKDMTQTNGEIRTEPGAAGHPSAPRVLDDPQDKAPRGNRGLLIGMAAGAAIILLVLLLGGWAA